MKAIADGSIEVLTFKEGLLSKVAHDLQLTLEQYRIESDGRRVEGEFRPDSLSVVGAMRRGVLDTGVLSDGDRREIGVNIREKVLHTDRHPTATFSGRVARGDGKHRLVGPLTLAGVSHEIAFDVLERDGRWTGEVEIQPSRWDVQPFKALLGAIKLQDRVIVRFDFPVAEL
jgi:polyisoprenoid-binding protein YceI